MTPIPDGYELIKDQDAIIKDGDLFEFKDSWKNCKNSIGHSLKVSLLREVIRSTKKKKEDSIPPQTTLTKEQLKHAFGTVPEGCVVIMEPETVLRKGDYWLDCEQWKKANGLVGERLKNWDIYLAARPITPTPPKGYYLIYNPDEIIKEGDLHLYLSNKYNLVQHMMGESIGKMKVPYICRPANFLDIESGGILIDESPPKLEKETIIEPIQFSIEHL